jgi:hypothetical protein
MKANTCIWIALMLLSVSSFSVSENARSTAGALIILAVAGVKAGMVAWQFMELRAAHLAWKIAFPLLFAGTLGLIALLNRIL